MAISFTPGAINAPSLVPSETRAGASASGSEGFRNVLQKTIDDVEAARSQADAMANSFIKGGNEELHSVALATQRAELEFSLLLQIRNKVVSAYQEVMRMQV